MNHTCVVECLLEQSRKVGVLENFSELNIVSPRCLLRKLSVCSYHVTCAFQIESTLFSCLNVRELLAWNSRDIWSLSDCNWTRTQNHLVRKRTLNHLANFVRKFLVAASVYFNREVSQGRTFFLRKYYSREYWNF